MNPIDEYLAKEASEFARPILNHLRKLIHRACPDVEETLKWGFPHFLYKGMLCSMAAFKQHCAFGFWKGDLMFAGSAAQQKRASGAMGHFGRITSLKDLPDDKNLLACIREAMRLNEEGIKRPARPRPTQRKELQVPEPFSAALKQNRKAQKAFDNFSYSHKKEYVEWVSEAKRDETREKRIETSIAWLAEGKSRHWKYSRC